MRITNGIMTNTMLSNLQLGESQLASLQQEATSGFRVSTPGDDPLAAQQVLQLKGLLQNSTQYASNITTGTAWLDQSDSAMSDMGNVVTQANEIAEEMANGTSNSSDMSSAASQVTQLQNELIQLGNTQVDGQYIFGGFDSGSPPFDSTTGAYNGTNDAVNMEVSQGEYVAINVSGGNLLRGGTPPGSTGTDIIGALGALSTALTNGDTSGIQSSITTLQNAQNQILAARADVGSRTNQVQDASTNLTSENLSLNTVISDKQNIDLVQVASALTSQETAFQAALAVSAQTAQLSLLNYLK